MPPTACRDRMPLGSELLFHPRGSMPPERGGQRTRAIEHVLQCIPEEDYKQLRRVCLLAPQRCIQGSVIHLPSFHKGGKEFDRYAHVLYLAPELERSAWDVVVGIVAHEFAHLLLGHNAFPKDEERPVLEDEAWAKVREWGFDVEARKCRAVSKRACTLLERRRMVGQG